MSSFRQILYHLLFRTKESKKTLKQTHLKELFAYILGIIKNKNCVLHSINGTDDHIHLLSDLHHGIALADYINDIKVASSI
jgi:REP element-mobilizing transposase RayT